MGPARVVACAVLLRAFMHYLAKSMKRGHWSSIKFLKPLAARFELTPARFDLLYCALRMRGDAYQTRLARKLGVSKTTVCKMLSAMEAAGLVVRLDRNLVDRRHRRWNLTEHGRHCVRGLMKVIRRGLVDHAIRVAIEGPYGLSRSARSFMVQTTHLALKVALSFDWYGASDSCPYERSLSEADDLVRREIIETLRARDAAMPS